MAPYSLERTTLDRDTARALNVVYSRTGLSISPEPWVEIDRALMDMGLRAADGDVSDDVALACLGAALERTGSETITPRTGEPDQNGLDAIARAIANAAQQ